MSDQEDTVVRAALFYKEQRVSQVYTKKYMTEGISVKDLVVSHENHWGDTYAKEKMIDGNPATRWASKGVDTSKPMELTLTFAKAELLSQMNLTSLCQEIMRLVHLKFKRLWMEPTRQCTKVQRWGISMIRWEM